MTLQIGNIEYKVDTFIFTVDSINKNNLDTVQNQKRIYVVIPNGIDLDIEELNQNISANFNGTLKFITRYGEYIYENYIFHNLELQVTDSSFDLTANFIHE